MSFEHDLTSSALSRETFREYPSGQILDNNEIVSRATDLQMYNSECAIFRAWIRELPKKIDADLKHCAEPTAEASIAVALSAAKTLCNFRTEYKKTIFPALLDDMYLRCAIALAQQWANFWVQCEMKRHFQMPHAGSFYQGGFGRDEHFEFLAPWFNDMGLSHVEIYRALARLAPQGTAAKF